MLKPRWTLSWMAAFAMALAAVGCGSSEEPGGPALLGGDLQSEHVAVRVITAEDIRALGSDDRLTLASAAGQALVFDPARGPIDFGRIDLICPNGAQMPADAWLYEQSVEQGLDLPRMTTGKLSLARSIEEASFAFRSEESGSYHVQNEDDDFESDCWCCEDGSCVCW